MKERPMNNELQETAKRLFDTLVNRRDNFAFQLDDGRYFASHKDLTVQHIEEHLRGEITLGVYLLDQNNMAKYTVIDADDEEGLAKLETVQQSLGLSSYLESS